MKKSNDLPKAKRLAGYLAAGLGAGCLAQTAEAVVTFYGVNSANDTNADPAGLRLAYLPGYYHFVDTTGSSTSFLGIAGNSTFSRGDDRAVDSSYTRSMYYDIYEGDGFVRGAVAGDQNYASISFDGDDDVYEAVAQFFFDGSGGGYLIAITTTNPVPNPQDLSAVGGPALSISDGKAMIDAAVPEPSALALLSLGAGGLHPPPPGGTPSPGVRNHDPRGRGPSALSQPAPGPGTLGGFLLSPAFSRGIRSDSIQSDL
jgi:hypothetical protein